MLDQIGVSWFEVKSTKQWNDSAGINDVLLVFDSGSDINTPMDRNQMRTASGRFKYKYSINWHTMKITTETDRTREGAIGWGTRSRFGAMKKPNEAPIGYLIHAWKAAYSVRRYPANALMPEHERWVFWGIAPKIYILR